MSDPHPEIGGRTVACTCHRFGQPEPAKPANVTELMAADDRPEDDDGHAMTAWDARAFVDKDIA
jgi:hypothetical protein